MGQQELSHAEWGRVVLVAGIGTILEWFDFYCYTQLNSVLELVFFPTNDPTIQALAFWGVYAAAFVVRPLGGIVFGHIGDTQGRNKCLTISIFCMALSTIAVGLLPTYAVGRYSAGVAAPILLALLRLVQGLAMGGEFGSAVIYISELADRRHRGKMVALLQLSAHTGMVLATLLVIALQKTLSHEAMLVWGWRVPFLCSFATALLGACLRKGMPEPHAFLTAARAANKRRSGSWSGGPIGPPELAGAEGEGDLEAEIVSPTAKAEQRHRQQEEQEEQEEEAATPKGALGALHGHSDVRTPIVRLLRNNLTGLLLHVCYMAWVSGAFYVTVSWLAKDLRSYGYPLLQTQGLLIVSLLCNAVGLFATGALIDRGARVLAANAAAVAVGSALAFGVFKGVGASLPAAWGVVCMFHVVIGCAMALVGLPATRIYEPLERTTGFSFAYNTGYGIIGGLSPLAVAAIKAGLPHAQAAFAPAFWLLALGCVSMLGSLGLRLYAPRLGQPYVGKVE